MATRQAIADALGVAMGSIVWRNHPSDALIADVIALRNMQWRASGDAVPMTLRVAVHTHRNGLLHACERRFYLETVAKRRRPGGRTLNDPRDDR